MRTTSQGWKDNQLSQLRSESLIKVVFPTYDTYTHISWVEEDYDDDRIPYIEIENKKKISGIVSLGDGSYMGSYTAYITLELTTGYTKTLTISMGTNVNIKITYYRGSRRTTETFTNVNSVEVNLATTNDKVDIAFDMISSTYSMKKVSINYIKLKNNTITDETLTKDDIVKVNINSKVDLINRELPTNQLVLEVDNTEKQYDVYNPNSKYYELAKGKEVKVFFGYVINGSEEWIDGGTFYISDWSTDTSGLTFQIIAQNCLSLMEATFYGARAGIIYEISLERYVSKLYDIREYYALPILRQTNGYIGLNFVNNTDVDDIDSPTLTTMAQWWQYIGNLTRTTINITKDNVIDMFELDRNAASVYEINDNNCYSQPLSTFENNKYGIITIKYVYTDVDSNSYTTVFADSYNDWTKNYVSGLTPLIDVETFVEQTYYGYDKPTQTGTNANRTRYIEQKGSYQIVFTSGCQKTGNYWVKTLNTIKAKTLKQTQKTYNIVVDSEHIDNALDIDLPPASLIYPNVFADWVYGILQYNQVIECNLRIDPALDLLDMVDLGSLGIRGIVESIDLTFDGAYKGIVKVRRMPQPSWRDIYQQVEYIESTGTQYIQLPFAFSSIDKIETQFSVDTTQTEDKYMVAPSSWNTNNNRFGMGVHDGGKYTCAYGNISTSNTALTPTTVNDGNLHNWKYEHRTFQVVDLSLSKDVSTITFGGDTANLKLFYGYNSNTVGKMAYYRHYNYLGELVADLVACYRKSDGVIGMYDIKNDRFYTNSGTGTFIKGGNI